MQLLDVRPDLLQIVQDILQKHVPERAVWAFGSRAKWLTKENSDLDLCIVGETPLSFTTLGLLKEAFEESDLPWKVDVVDWATTSESFRKIIERDKVVVKAEEKGLCGASKWRECTLGDVLELQRGFDLPIQERKDGTYPIIASTGAVGFHAKAMVKAPGLVIGRSGSLGGGQYVRHDFWPLNTTLWVKNFKGNDIRFCFYLLKSIDFKNFNVGGAVPTLNRNHVHPLPVRVPDDIYEQRAIAHILGTLDDKIELNRKQNETLEAMAQALFKSWFVDFEPVRAKLEGRWQKDSPLPEGEGAGVRAIPPQLLQFARENRQKATDAEQLMWRLLRNKQLGVKFRRQHPLAPYILDFYCHEKKLVLELDGSQHYTDEGRCSDVERTAFLNDQGLTVLRFTNREVLLETEGVLGAVWEALTPNPSPTGRGEYLPAYLYDLFPDRLVDSELGEIPQGWRHSMIGEEVTVCGGATPSTKDTEFWEGGRHCWATPKDLSALKFPVMLNTDRKITDAGLAKISSGLLPIGTVLLSSRAPIGYLAIAEVPTAINQGFIAMKCDSVLPSVFVLAWCRESMDAIVSNANGSTFQEISKNNFRPVPVVVPSESVLAVYTKLADSLYRKVVENERESRSLAQLRDTLLPKLISGELRVPDAERVVGALS